MWVWIIVVVVVLAALLVVLSRRGSDRRPPVEPGFAPVEPAPVPGQEPWLEPEPEPLPEPEPRLPRAAVIVNPTKFDDVDAVRAEVTEVCQELGWDEPLWLETTENDPGSGQTKEAIDAGVEVICPLGGDGTVRTVGSELTAAGDPVPMGLLPGGTGNLLARNLDLPVDSLRDALVIALTGEVRTIDVGVLTVDPAPQDDEHEVDDEQTDADSIPPEDSGPEEMYFLVMAGMGFDADIMADAPEGLKAAMGWPAYIVSGLKHLWGSQFKARVETDTERFTRRTRSVIVGNCGKIQGLALMPEAQVDDGRLDALVLSPDGGIGWGAVALRLITAQRKGHHRVTHHTTRTISVRSDQPVQVQLDGDTIGERTGMRATVVPLALSVRVADATPDTGATPVAAGQHDSGRE
ncbi:diacylglycerol/lipid kinase family protein [Arsenicicoccus dermatophilus]|uniref:diacylglycerol/lipid kinase family protein n=1 Tax=Arsenicicoccus dermatophilus TaxID=1076331 RepID=UPI001F4C63BA|nr:diacylglycerol kinase family protein [Arsenicicoccus dermatophilus]MCH8611525.1 diacylglycerol kinase family lipid kinase [Arsenicicoccus dermatophilus]